jgi:hypothetical protein
MRNLAQPRKPRPGQDASGQADDKAWKQSNIQQVPTIWLWLRYMLTGYVPIRIVNEDGTWVSFTCPSWERAIELRGHYRERGHRRTKL